MRSVAEGVILLSGLPRDAVNVYLADGVLIDSGLPFYARGLLAQLRGRQVRAHALTHAHPDHQGSSRAICRALGLPYWVPEGDVAAAESGRMDTQFPNPRHPLIRFQQAVLTGPGHPVQRALREGDTVGSFTVVDAPGHTPGHVAYFRERDRVLILGDVLANMHMETFRPGLAETPALFTVNRAQNLDSARKLAALRPSLVLFGHGAPEIDGDRFQTFIAGLPRGAVDPAESARRAL